MLPGSGLHPHCHCLSVGLLGHCFLLFPGDPGSRHLKEQTPYTICLCQACPSPGAPCLGETLLLPQSARGHLGTARTPSSRQALAFNRPPGPLSHFTATHDSTSPRAVAQLSLLIKTPTTTSCLVSSRPTRLHEAARMAADLILSLPLLKPLRPSSSVVPAPAPNSLPP